MATAPRSPTPSLPLDFADLPWSAPSNIVDNGIHDGYSTVPLVKSWKRFPSAERFSEYLTDAYWAVISKLSPGGYLLPHQDKGPHYTRIQIPLEEGGWYWDDQVGALRMQLGVANTVRHHRPHSVWNDTDHDRIHLVIDRLPSHSDGPFIAYNPQICPPLHRFLTGALNG